MKVSLNWLKRYIDIGETPEVLARDLTMFGLNVEGIERSGPDFTGVVFGKVLECVKHPEADRLSVCTVDAGGEKPLNVVCGAPNVRKGLSVAVALNGAVLPGGFKIKKTKLRGVVSEGMICSETELGIGDDSSGIIELDSDLTPGESLESSFGKSDTVLDIEVTPNRPDQLSHIGVARELAALYKRELKMPSITELKPEGDFHLEIEDPSDCPRYSAALVDDVVVEPSPAWMQELLVSAGVKPINNIVDVTNFVLMELGQPLHAFDRDRLKKDSILVRRAFKGETLYTLDGIERELDQNVLVITDGENPIGVAGVMGGLDSEVGPGTKRLLIESAHFGSTAIRMSSHALKLDTEASYRYERESDPGITVKALGRACRLIEEIGAGRVQKVYSELQADPEVLKKKSIELRVKQANRVMGTRLGVDDLAELLSRLDLDSVKSGKDLVVSIPTYRRDLREEIDLVEEVARVYGYENIGREEERKGGIFSKILPADRRNEEIAVYLASRGYAEVIGSSFMDPADIERFEWLSRDRLANPVKIANPLTQAQSVLRTSLLPGMLRIVGRNAPVEQEGIKIFELSRIFLQSGSGEGLPDEELHLCILMTRKAAPVSWAGEQRSFDFFDIKGEAEALFERLGMPAEIKFERKKEAHPHYTYNWLLNNKIIAECGKIPDRVAGRYDIDTPLFYFDLSMDLVPPGGYGPDTYSAISPYPLVKRDLCVVSSDRVTFADIRNIIKKRAKNLEYIRLFDYYRGGQLGEGKRSYTFRLGFRSFEGTLEDKVIDRVIDKVLEALKKELQVTLRAE